MNNVKKTAPVLAHEDGTTSVSACGPDTPIETNSTANLSSGQSFSRGLAEFLPRGASNAITGATLAEIIGCRPREISKAVEALRRHGVPVCASCGDPRGYFIAADPDEFREYIASLDRRLRQIRSTRAACRDTLAVLYGQRELEGVR